MREIVGCCAFVLIGLWFAVGMTRQHRPRVTHIALAALAAHLAATVAQVFIVRDVYGYGDMLTYIRHGEALARYADLTGDLGAVVSAALGGEPRVPLRIHGLGGPTGAAAGISGLLHYYFGGIWATNLFMTVFAFAGQIAIYAALARGVDERRHVPLALGCLLVPSMVFWTAALQKEAVAFGGLGMVTLGLRHVVDRELLRGVLMTLVGAFILSISKPYLLFTLAASAGVYVYWERSMRGGNEVQIRPGVLLVAASVAGIAFIGLGELFPRYALGNLGEEAMRLQQVGGRVTGGSSYLLVDPASDSMLTKIAFLPLALLTSLFRPLIIEVSNAMMLINAAETTAFVYLFYRIFRRHRPGGVYRLLKGNPTLMFMVAMTFMVALGVGISSTNLGTLSRYRTPMLPFYAGLLLLLYTAEPARAGGRAPTPSRDATHQPKPHVVVALLRPGSGTVRNAHVLAPGVERAASHATWPPRRGIRAQRVHDDRTRSRVVSAPVPHPLPDVARHVEEAPCVRGFLCDRMRTAGGGGRVVVAGQPTGVRDSGVGAVPGNEPELRVDGSCAPLLQ